ncbi:MAG TPA: cytochrome c [Paracoccaceae bacterium]|nr:cytochrome c [Paracoccaceae bacterium]
MRDLAAGLMGAMVVLAAPAAAQDEGAGAALYQRHCAMCHGVEATGRGPLAPDLPVQSTDLTGLAAAGGGEFPYLRAARRIDGRDPLVAHGSPMPVWGEYFEGAQAAIRLPGGQPLMASRPVIDLLAFLVSVQRPD